MGVYKASVGYVPPSIEELMERGASLVAAAAEEDKELAQQMADRMLEMASNRMKRSKDDEEEFEGGRPAAKKAKDRGSYHRR